MGLDDRLDTHLVELGGTEVGATTLAELASHRAGLPTQADRTIVRGNPASGRFAVFHLCGDRIVRVEAVSAPPEFMAGKQLIQRRTPVDDDKLMDLDVSMKAVASNAGPVAS